MEEQLSKSYSKPTSLWVGIADRIIGDIDSYLTDVSVKLDSFIRNYAVFGIGVENIESSESKGDRFNLTLESFEHAGPGFIYEITNVGSKSVGIGFNAPLVYDLFNIISPIELPRVKFTGSAIDGRLSLGVGITYGNDTLHFGEVIDPSRLFDGSDLTIYSIYGGVRNTTEVVDVGGVTGYAGVGARYTHDITYGEYLGAAAVAAAVVVIAFSPELWPVVIPPVTQQLERVLSLL
jgi:hypothetical protein